MSLRRRTPPIPRAHTGPQRSVVAAEGTFGRALHDARERAGLTRADMSRLLDVPGSRITEWEGGRRAVDEELVHRYAAALGLDVRLVLERRK